MTFVSPAADDRLTAKGMSLVVGARAPWDNLSIIASV
jgi:hypothetical protein